MRWSLVRHITGQYVKAEIDAKDSPDQQPRIKNMHHYSHQNWIRMQNTLGLLKNTNRYPCFNSNPKLSNKLSWLRTGETKTFVKSTLSLDESNNSFYSPIKRTPYTTFADMKRKMTVVSKSGRPSKIAVLNPDFVFRRALVLWKCR